MIFPENYKEKTLLDKYQFLLSKMPASYLLSHPRKVELQECTDLCEKVKILEEIYETEEEKKR